MSTDPDASVKFMNMFDACVRARAPVIHINMWPMSLGELGTVMMKFCSRRNKKLVMAELGEDAVGFVRRSAEDTYIPDWDEMAGGGGAIYILPVMALDNSVQMGMLIAASPSAPAIDYSPTVAGKDAMPFARHHKTLVVVSPDAEMSPAFDGIVPKLFWPLPEPIRVQEVVEELVDRLIQRVGEVEEKCDVTREELIRTATDVCAAAGVNSETAVAMIFKIASVTSFPLTHESWENGLQAAVEVM